MFSPHGRAIVRVDSVHVMNTAPASSGRRLLHQANWLEPQARLYNCIHHRHLSLLLTISPKAHTHGERVSSFLMAHQHIKGHSVHERFCAKTTMCKR